MKFISDLKRRISYPSVWEHLYGAIPENKKCLCPVHNENTPSFSIFDDGGYCFGCGAVLDHIDLIMHKLGISFKDAIQYLNTTFLNQNYVSDLKCFEEKKPSFSSSHYSHPINQMLVDVMERKLNDETQYFLRNKGTLPYKFKIFYENRSFDLDLLQRLEFYRNNILFLNNRKEFVSYLERQFDLCTRQKSGFYKHPNKYGKVNICWLHDESFCLLLPKWTISKDGLSVVPTSFIIRNIQTLSDYPKEIEFIIQGLKRPFVSGFSGLKYAYNKYPDAVLNRCYGLTVMLVEGMTDFIAAHELIHKFNIIKGDKNAHIIVLTAGSVDTTSKIENLLLIKNCEKLIVAFDNDEAGRTGFQNVQAHAQSLEIKKVQKLEFRNDCNDLNELLKSLKGVAK